MEAMLIEILNPKVKGILNNLEDLKLISIKPDTKNTSEIKELLSKLRANSDIAPSLEEITREVEIVRKQRYARQ